MIFNEFVTYFLFDSDITVKILWVCFAIRIEQQSIHENTELKLNKYYFYGNIFHFYKNFCIDFYKLIKF